MTLIEKNNYKVWLAVVLTLAIILRVLLFTLYPAVSYSDTASYRRAAEAVLGGFEVYDGTRTPGYPAFMALIGPDRAVYASQLVMGLVITALWFVVGWKASEKPWFGALIALAHTLNPGQFFFEANLLTETLSTFLLVLSLTGAYLWLDNHKYRSIWMGLGIGLSASLAALTRPIFIFMPVWLVIFLSFTYKNKHLSFDLKPFLSVMMPAILLIGGWMYWIQSNYHVFSMTTMTGYHLVQHTGYYFEDVPDENADLRDVYLEYRESRMEERGTQGNTIWDAIPAMQAVSGMNFYELSRTLQRISLRLIITHPWEYLSRVMRGWWLFWRAPVYWDNNAFSSQILASASHYLILGARGLLFLTNLIFIFTSVGALVSERLRQTWRLSPFHWMIGGSVWATSALSSLLDHGDNPRFLVPMQTFVLFWVFWIIYSSWQSYRSGRNHWSNRRI